MRSKFHTTRALVALILTSLGLLATSAQPARAVWADGADLIYRSAHTLDEGEFEVGIFSPLQYGISDQIQISMHPILLLVLTPHASLRWRVLPEGALTLALDLTATWSFLNEEDIYQRRSDDSSCSDCGFPGSTQLTTTLSWEINNQVTWSVGGGVGMDLLDIEPLRGLIELHTSLIWRIDTENLLMAHANINIHPWHREATSREQIQVMYAHAWGFIHLGVGLAFGDFVFVEAVGSLRDLPGASGASVIYEGDQHALPIYPVVDVWIRL